MGEGGEGERRKERTKERTDERKQEREKEKRKNMLFPFLLLNELAKFSYQDRLKGKGT